MKMTDGTATAPEAGRKPRPLTARHLADQMVAFDAGGRADGRAADRVSIPTS